MYRGMTADEAYERDADEEAERERFDYHYQRHDDITDYQED